MSLPPELGAIDDAWGKDEQPTIARPSRVPTSPARINIPSEAPTAPGYQSSSSASQDAPGFEPHMSGLDLAPLENEDDKVTTVPEIPLDEFARRAMRSDKAHLEITEAPPPPPMTIDPPIMIDPADIEELEFNPTASEMPTAPPAKGFNSQRIASRGEVPPPASVAGIAVEPTGPTFPPPLAAPRSDGPVFSGRFSSAPPGSQSDEARMKGKFAMGDFSGALGLAEALLDRHPRNEEARSVAKKCREVLSDMYSSRISGLHRVPAIAMTSDQIRWLSLDHRAGFILSMIDGISSVDDLLDVSGMPRLDALRIVCELLDAKAISLS